jgi:hypothetical protein
LRSILDSELHTRHVDRVFVTYHALLENWKDTTDRIAQMLDIAWPRSAQESAAEVDDFLSDELRHHKDEKEVQPHELPELVRETFDTIKTAAETDLEDPAPFLAAFDGLRVAFGQVKGSSETGRQHIHAFPFGRHINGMPQDASHAEIEFLSKNDTSTNTQLAAPTYRTTLSEQSLAQIAERIGRLEQARIDAELECISASEACLEAHKRLAEARSTIHRMKRSASWRLTKPLRSFARILTLDERFEAKKR